MSNIKITHKKSKFHFNELSKKKNVYKKIMRPKKRILYSKKRKNIAKKEKINFREQ